MADERTGEAFTVSLTDRTLHTLSPLSLSGSQWGGRSRSEEEGKASFSCAHSHALATSHLFHSQNNTPMTDCSYLSPFSRSIYLQETGIDAVVDK